MSAFNQSSNVDISNNELHLLLRQLIKEQSDIIVKQVNESINTLKCDLDKANKEITELRKENTALKQKVSQLGKAARNQNLVVFGISYDINENKHLLLDSILNKINTVSDANFTINDIIDLYRVGKTDKHPIIVKFVSVFARDNVLKLSGALKKSGIIIKKDLSLEERQGYAILRQNYNIAKGCNLDPKISGSNLVVKDQNFSIEALTSEAVDFSLLIPPVSNENQVSPEIQVGQHTQVSVPLSSTYEKS